MSTDVSEAEPFEHRNTIENELCQDSEILQNAAPKRTFTKTFLKQGEGFLRPYLESVCVVDITYRTNENAEILGKGECLKNLKIPIGKNVELTLGSAETTAGRILEKCILTMRKGEESEFVIKSLSDVHQDVDVQGHIFSVLLVINLHHFSETKPTWSLTSEEKHQLALRHKEKGTNFFRDGKTEAAFCQYSIAVIYLICITEVTSVIDEELEPETKSQRQIYKALKCVCYLNLAACQMKVGNHKSVINNCTHALSLDNTNVKGWYRRATAYLACGQITDARYDLEQALEIEPANRVIASLLQKCQQ